MSSRLSRGKTCAPQIVTIDVDSVDDDDVILVSATSFARANCNSRRNRGRPVFVDLDAETSSSHLNSNRNSRNRVVPRNQQVINCESYVNLESGTCSLKKRDGRSREQAAPPPPLPHKEPTFSCPICMGEIVEEMSTKCGHIFCKACIKAAIAAQSKCPTCRKKVTLKDTFRIYLPNAN